MWFQHLTLLFPQVYTAVANTSFEDFQKFLAEFKEQVFISVVAKGDVDKECSLRCAKAITDIISYDALPPCSQLGHAPPLEACTINILLNHTAIIVYY